MSAYNNFTVEIKTEDKGEVKYFSLPVKIAKDLGSKPTWAIEGSVNWHMAKNNGEIRKKMGLSAKFRIAEVIGYKMDNAPISWDAAYAIYNKPVVDMDNLMFTGNMMY